jgi:hypothetical protein
MAASVTGGNATRTVSIALSGAAALCCALGLVVLAWPVFRAPAVTVLDTVSLYGPAGAGLVQRDINLTIWTLAWVSRALVTDPLHLFDANVFYPARATLASTEHMLGNAPFFAPVYLASGNPILAHQVTLIASFAIAGFAMAAYLQYWTRDRAAALAAAVLFAFAPYRFWQLGNLHVISIGYLPMVLLGVDAILDRRGGWRGSACLVAALLLSALCSYYVGYAAFTLAGIYLVLGVAGRGRAALSRLGPALAAIAVAAVGVGALSAPYVMLQQGGVIRDYTRPGAFSLALLSMVKLGPTGLLGCFVKPGCESVPQFLTYGVLAAAGIGVWLTRGGPRWALVGAAVAAVILSLGPTLPIGGEQTLPLPWRIFAATIPGFSAMRIPQRFGAVVTTAVVALAGLGLAELRTRLRVRGQSGVGAVAIALLVGVFLFETTPRDLRTTPMPIGESVPVAYRWLAEHGNGGALLELPAGEANFLYRQSVAMYFSTVHWLPMVNGYSAYPPPPFREIMDEAQRLPAPDALARILARVPLRWILVHRDQVAPQAWPAWQATLATALTPVLDTGDLVVYEPRAVR